MLLKNCPRCKALMPYGKQYCPKCAAEILEQRKEQRKSSDRRYNRNRDPKIKRFYNSGNWRKLSEARLNAEKRCRFCGEPATEVDHIIPIQTPEGWARRLDWNNTRSLCHKCHDKRHDRFQKKQQRKPRIDGGG